jgi:hypothetical protein
VVIWAIVFAFVEAAVVEYLRAVYYPIDRGGFEFPVLTVGQLHAMGAEHWRRLLIELGREMCTLVMLATVGLMASSNRREAWALFVVAFGVWDIFYYVWLKLFLGWPPGLMTWDLLFLIPVPWVSPVLAPVLISLTMIVAGVVALTHEYRGTPLYASWGDWALLTAGGLMVIASFCLDYANIMKGGFPEPFHWPLFSTGWLVGIASFSKVVYRGGRRSLPNNSFS